MEKFKGELALTPFRQKKILAHFRVDENVYNEMVSHALENGMKIQYLAGKMFNNGWEQYKKDNNI